MKSKIELQALRCAIRNDQFEFRTPAPATVLIASVASACSSASNSTAC